MTRSVRPDSAAPLERRQICKLPQDTVQGCRDRAVADLLEAATMVGANQRLRLERSSQSWSMRADLLDGVEKDFERRRALDRKSRTLDRLSDQYEVDHLRL
jgi:hypothetical protein